MRLIEVSFPYGADDDAKREEAVRRLAKSEMKKVYGRPNRSGRNTTREAQRRLRQQHARG